VNTPSKSNSLREKESFHKEIAELLITAGADVNAKTDDGETPLYWAVEEGHKEIVELLRKHDGKTGEELK
jgi:ankyrin repeat protein